MTIKNLGLGIVVSVSLAGLVGCASESGPSTSSTKDSFGGDRQAINLTVFNEDFAQVGEERPWSVKNGQSEIRLGDISKTMDPSSVLFNWKSPDVQVTSSIYDLGIGNTNELLSRYIGQKVEMVWYGNTGQPGARETGILELSSGGGTVLRTGDKLIMNPTGTIIAPVKAGVTMMPGLTLGVESSKAVDSSLGVTYLTRGLSWTADHVAIVDPDKDEMRFESWASITNSTGVDYPAAKVTLVAGAPNRLAEAKYRSEVSAMAGDSDPKPAAMNGATMNRAFAPVDIGELQAYPIKAETTIRQNQINRARMLYSPTVKIKRDYSVELGDYAYNYYNSGWTPRRRNAQLAIQFVNSKESGLGVSLPGGGVRFYEPDGDGQNRYIGAATIPDTAVNSSAYLTLSNVFNLSIEPKVLSQKRLNKRELLKEMSIKIMNSKKSAVELRIVNRFYSNFRITAESVKGRKLDASSQEWKVPVPANGTVTLKVTAIIGV